jgi:hypothetical protein
VETPHDRIAKRRAEIAEQQAALDAEAEPRGEAKRRPGGAARSAIFLTLVVVLGVGLLGLAITLNRLAGSDFADAKRQGTAQVTSCVRHGPISTRGFGYWQMCTATITWDAGRTDRVTVGAVFEASEIGTQVRVGDMGNYRTSKLLTVAGTPYRPWLAWIGYVVGALAFIPVLIATLIIRELLRRRR